MRIPIIAGNHKMNLNPEQTGSFLQEFKKEVEGYDQVQIIVCPPFTSLAVAKEVLAETHIELGAQNMHQAAKGAYTGEISAEMLLNSGCDWVICGHSERRQLFGECNAIVNQKINAAVKAGLKPILCVGETLEEREHDKTEKVLISQLINSLYDLKQELLADLVIAYEPVWAIGTGQTATPEDAEQGCQVIRTQLARMYNDEFAQGTRILYGGSVKPNNIKSLMNEENVDGALVGGASLKSSDLAAIVKYNEQ